eukprot:scaffold532_cov275-Chaetoceros_neogracile.AAC.12
MMLSFMIPRLIQRCRCQLIETTPWQEVDDDRDEPHQCTVVANLDVEGDDGDYLDDEIEAEADDTDWRYCWNDGHAQLG